MEDHAMGDRRGVLGSCERASCVLLAAAVWAASMAATSLGQVQLENATLAAGLELTHAPQAQNALAYVTGGMAAADFDRDGFCDVFVANGGGGPDWLFINNGDGTFTDQAAAWGLTELYCGNGVAVADYDDDGWLDLYVTSMGNQPGPDMPGVNRLYRNLAGRGFANEAQSAGVNVASPTNPLVFGAAFGDYDLDGDLDLMVVTWQPFTGGNRLYRNNGNGTFTNVTSSALSISTLNNIFGFQPAFADMNGDLYPELLIAADFQTSRYYINDRDGTFTHFTVPSGTGLDDNGMGQTVADFNRDGMLDWYVTSIYADAPPPTNYPGNTLYLATSAHQYDEVAAKAGVDDGGWGWGTLAFDIDLDGWEDIVEVNGRETNPPGEWTNEQGYLYSNNGDGTFTEMAQASGFDQVGSGRAVVYLDADNDGDLDFATLTNAGPLDFYLNQSKGGHWLQVEMDTSINPLLPPDGYGVRLEADVAGSTLVRYMDGKPSFLGTSQLVAHFGLGPATLVDELRLIWSRGYVTTLHDVAADQKLQISAPALADLDADGVVGVGDLIKVILSWGPVVDPITNLVADTNNDGEVNVTDLIEVVVSWGEY
jgi:hypothetical protein